MKWFTSLGFTITTVLLVHNALSLTIHSCSVQTRASVILAFVATYDVDVISELVISYSSCRLTESLSCRDVIDEEVEPDSRMPIWPRASFCECALISFAQIHEYIIRNYTSSSNTLHVGWLLPLFKTDRSLLPLHYCPYSSKCLYFIFLLMQWDRKSVV